MPMTLTCAVCQATFTRPPSHAARVKTPTCSRQCNGKLRGEEWAKHGHKGRAAWSPETEARVAESMRGEKNHAWKGGAYIDDKGYRRVRRPNHPNAQQNGYVLEHVLVMSELLGRPLVSPEEVHHINRLRADNRPENLKLYPDHMSHWMTEHFETVQSARDVAASTRGTEEPGLA